MDRFSELNAFIAVVEAGGFSAAARRRGEGQPAISKAIAALEKRLGVALFYRSTRSVTLTIRGSAITTARSRWSRRWMTLITK